MADQQDQPPRREMPLGLAVHLADQRAGGVEIDHVAALRFGRHRFRHAMGGEHDRCVRRYLVQLLDEDRAFSLQRFDDEAVMHDLVAHIDRRAKLLQRPLDDLDGAIDTGAEAARAGEQEGERRF